MHTRVHSAPGLLVPLLLREEEVGEERPQCQGEAGVAVAWLRLAPGTGPATGQGVAQRALARTCLAGARTAWVALPWVRRPQSMRRVVVGEAEHQSLLYVAACSTRH